MKWKIYNRLMKPSLQDIEPIQPRREDRLFLRYSEKPSTPDMEETEGFYLEAQPIAKVVPRPDIQGINFTALQFWLDHLGPAVYTPITAYKDDDGEYHVDKDGGHRTRCLWEIGELSVWVMTRDSQKMSKGYMQWVRATAQKFESPTIEHFRINKSLTWRQFYPCIYPPTDILLKFFKEKKDGVYYRYTLDTPMSFKGILSQNKSLSYRMDILNEILKHGVKDKSLLDLGCYFGHYMFLLLEQGASKAVGVDNDKFRIHVANHLAVRRGINKSHKEFKAVHGDINHYIETSDMRPDIVLLLNVFHHLLAHDETRAWNTLNNILNRCDLLFLMTQNLKGVYDEWDGDIERAVQDRTGVTMTPLLKSRYRNRVLWVASPNK